MKTAKEKLNSIATKIESNSVTQRDCLITNQQSAYFLGQTRPIRRIMYAFYYYSGNLFALPADKWVSATCEHPNCIKKEHLVLRNKGRPRLTEEEKEERMLQKAKEEERRILAELAEEFARLAKHSR